MGNGGSVTEEGCDGMVSPSGIGIAYDRRGDIYELSVYGN